MSDSDIPQTSNAVAMYTSQGGQLTMFGMFGEDPLSSRPDLVSRCDHYFFTFLMTCFQMLCQKLEIFFLVLYWISFVLQIP